MKTKIHYALILASALAFAAPKAYAQEVIYYWDFNSTTGAAPGIDSLGTAYSYSHTHAEDSVDGAYPLYAPYSRPGPDKARILFTCPNGNGVLDYESNANQEGGNPGPCDDSVLINSSWYHGIQYNGVLYPECSWTNDLHLLGNDSGTGVAVPYLGSTENDENTEEGGNVFIRSKNPSAGSFMYLYMPTTGYKNVILNFALSTSSTGNIPYLLLSYTDDGHYWKNLTRAMDTFNLSGVFTPDTILATNYPTGWSFWQLRTINFTSDDSANNNANFAVRWGFSGSESSHNTRYDNFSLSGDSTVATGINTITQDNSIKVYPNPNNGKFNIVVGTQNFASVQSVGAQNFAPTIEVYNILGENIYTTKLNAATNTTIDLSNNPAGVYMYRVLSASGALVGEGKLIIQK